MVGKIGGEVDKSATREEEEEDAVRLDRTSKGHHMFGDDNEEGPSSWNDWQGRKGAPTGRDSRRIDRSSTRNEVRRTTCCLGGCQPKAELKDLPVAEETSLDPGRWSHGD